jgi:hypothetical protein
MDKLKDQVVCLIGHNSARKVSLLSGRYVRAKSGHKEAIQAAIEVERWLAESCDDCLHE